MIIALDDPIFYNLDETLDFFVVNNIFSTTKPCHSDLCTGSMRFQIYNERNKKYILYRCSSSRKRFSAHITSLGLNKLLLLIYLLMACSTYRQLFLFNWITDSTINNIINRLNNCFAVYLNQHTVYLGGIGVTVQVDQTVISRRGLIRTPSNTGDNTADIIWILGGVDLITQQKKNSYVYIK